MGASGYRDHIVVCGWNSTARELIQELSTDEYTTRIVVIHDTDKNPAGEGVYFVNGDITTAHDLKRAGIEDALAAVVFPGGRLQRGRHEVDPLRDGDRVAGSPGPDRRRGQQPRPRRALPARRRRRDPGLLAAGLAADGALVALPRPGRAGDRHRLRRRGLELYRVQLPDEYVGLSVDQLSAKLRAEHRATLLSVSRGGQSYVNPPEDFRLSNGDDLVWCRVARRPCAAADGPRPGRVGRRLRPMPQPGRTPAIATPLPPFHVTVSVWAASTSVPTTRATTSSSGPAFTTVSGPTSWHPTSSTTGTSVAPPLPRTWAFVGRDSGPSRDRTRGPRRWRR